MQKSFTANGLAMKYFIDCVNSDANSHYFIFQIEDSCLVVNGLVLNLSYLQNLLEQNINNIKENKLLGKIV